MMQIIYSNIVEFIEGQYKESEHVYQKFGTPTLLTEYTLKLQYVYNWIWEQWFQKWSPVVFDLANQEIYNEQNLRTLTSPLI